MTVIPAAHLSPADMAHLGNNVGPTVRRDREQFAAINRSLAIHDEQIQSVEPAPDGLVRGCVLPTS